VRLEGLDQLKRSKELIGNRIRDLIGGSESELVLVNITLAKVS
jgi:hypothetical protein